MVKGLQNDFCHRCWSVVLRKVHLKLVLGFVLGVTLLGTGALENVVNIFF
jgi:hypothetical protein